MASKSLINDLSSSLREYRNYLLSEGVAIQYSHLVDRKMGKGNVYLGTPGGGFSVHGEQEWANLAIFINSAENKNYYLIVEDGSLLNVSFVIHNDIVRQRFSFIPCPFDYTPREISEFGLADLVRDSIASLDPASLRLVPRLRFEFDADADSDHPRGHLHIASSYCRIPTKAPVSPGRFLSFIFTHFYPKRQYIASSFLSASSSEDKSIREPSECRLMYLDWFDKI